MGKASRWFRGLLGLKTTADSKKKWSFTRSRKDKDHRNGVVAAPRGYDSEDQATKHAIPVAAATAAVADSALATAAVHLTSSGRNTDISVAGYRSHENRAAVTIQSHFRGYLSRRALRALKALVRLQALVRGHLVRKETAYILRRLQALVRAQARVRAGRMFVPESPYSSMKSTCFNYPGPATPEKFEHVIRSRSLKQQLAMLKRNGSRSSRSTNNDLGKTYTNGTCSDSRMGMGERAREQRSFTRPLTTDYSQSVKVLEVDTGKPHTASKGSRRYVHSTHLNQEKICTSFSKLQDSTEHQSVLSMYGEAQSLGHPMNCTQYVDESAYCTADNSPTFYSASSMGSSKRGVFTPTSSDCSRSGQSGYSDHPNYMAYTESSKAKARSFSAPKLRPQFERSSSTKKYSHQTYGDQRSSQRGSSLLANFTNKAYPGSGHLNRLGVPA